jgi:hypothetical protein
VFIAKHLDQLKGGRFPIEILIRGKDAAENEKIFVKIADKIKASGVCIRSELPCGSQNKPMKALTMPF